MEYPLYQPSSIYGAGSPYPAFDVFISVLYYLYIVLICVLMVFSAHAYLFVVLRRRLAKREGAQPAPQPDDLPRVSVQIPIYNEGRLAVQAVEAAARIDYPGDRLQIIFLDGSTDDTPQLVAPIVERLRRQGRNVLHYRRDNAVGYKAGALADGCRLAEADLIAIFDADFVPARSFLRRAVGHFTDPRVGCVQTRWGHRNANASLLTIGQSMVLDSFYGTELPVRSAFNLCNVFTGTCGVWRRACVEDAGGWQWDTLVEDMDLSYRAQLRGWRIVYDQTIATPGELPESFSALMRQQHRWTMGHAQVWRKHIRNVLKARWPLGKKTEALIQLTRWATYPCVLAMAVLMMPALIVNPQLYQASALESALGLLLFLLASGGAMMFYLSGQMVLHPRTWWRRLAYLPVLMGMTLALAPNCCRAIYRGIAGRREPFRKTPRAAEGPQRMLASEMAMTAVNGIVGLYLLACAVATFVAAWRIDAWAFLITAVALLLFAAGLLYAAWDGVATARAYRVAAERAVAPAA